MTDQTNTGNTSTDPFDALRRPDAPIAPSAAFAKQLRQRLTDELRPLLTARPTSTTSTATASATATRADATSADRTVTMKVTPYLITRNAAAALDFYRDAFGAVEVHRLVGDDGRVGHSEIMIGSTKLMMADEYPEIGALGPETRGGPTCSFDIDVVDPDKVDEMYQRAVELGATSMREPAEQFYGSRSATISDPFGHSWSFSAAVVSLTPEEYAARAAEDTGFGSFSVATAAPEPQPEAAAAPHPQSKHHVPGDVYYFTLPVQDMAKAQRFYSAVLGWRFDSPEHGHIDNITAPPGGLNDQSTDTGTRLWFVVDDIHTAVERVRANGGTASEPVNYESGWSSDCTDDQGTTFSLSVPSAEYSA